MTDARIVGGDVEKGAAALERAGEGGVAAGDDVDDAAGLFSGLEEPELRSLATGDEPDHDRVAVQRHTGVFAGDLDRRLASLGGFRFGENLRGATLAKADAAGDEIGLLRDAEAVAFHEHDLAGMDEIADDLIELAPVLLLEAPLLGDRVGGSRHVIALIEMLEQTLAEIHRLVARSGRADATAPANKTRTVRRET